MVQELSIYLIPQTGGIGSVLSKLVMSITQFGHHKQGQTKVQREGGFTDNSTSVHHMRALRGTSCAES
jgi:hypothetical protein